MENFENTQIMGENDSKDFSIFEPRELVEKRIKKVSLEEAKTEEIPHQAIVEMNQPEIIFQEEEVHSLESNNFNPTLDSSKNEENSSMFINSNGFSGMYLLVAISMVMMIGVSILGILLS